MQEHVIVTGGMWNNHNKIKHFTRDCKYITYYILTNSHSVASYIFLNLATLSTFAPFSVSIYNENGWIKELPSLDIGRSNHGCGHFINTDNKMVSIKRFFQMFSEDTLYFV